MWKRWISGFGVLALGGAAAMATPSYTAVFLPGNGAGATYANAIASNGQIVGYSVGGTNAALLWTNPYATPVDLTPSGYTVAQANGTDGAIQSGRAETSANVAVAWQSTSASATVLAVPPDISNYGAAGTGGGQIVGSGTSSDGEHALLWSDIDATAIDLNPTNYSSSGAHGTNGIQQVGSGMTSINGQQSGFQALLWSGTAASAQNITPAGYGEARAYAISGNLVAGSGSPATGQTDALLWNISNGTYTDLGPGEAYAISGSYEAGYRGNDAMVWTGGAATAVNLQSFLPSGYAYSVAYGVDSEGDVVGAAGSYGQWQAVVWLVPEPTIVAIAPIFVLVVRCRRSGR